MPEDTLTLINRVNPTTMLDSTGMGHSQISIVEPGRLAFLSGQIGAPTNGGPVPGDLVEQAKIAVASLSAALEELRAKPWDIVMVRLYVVDGTRERFEAVWPILLSFFGGALPSASVLGVTGLAAPELQVEIEMVVRIP